MSLNIELRALIVRALKNTKSFNKITIKLKYYNMKNLTMQT